ncbi:hypothetical protein HQN86_00515 [Pedobacter panaciterrae]|uniref:hypothetical protein n=1 Tax=Pedobacter panaciterrae TaxID=363849 RepID=UPI00155DC183|nr:hypothetical protein [Pedobacter panaciterrae]NQX52085.1 hypothetical protein [Pedobacter panaciterrae]
MKIDLTFKSTYEIEVLNGIGSEERHYYPKGQQDGGKGGLIIKIVPHFGKTWVGIFAFDEISNRSLSGVYTTPDPDRFLHRFTRKRLCSVF